MKVDSPSSCPWSWLDSKLMPVEFIYGDKRPKFGFGDRIGLQNCKLYLFSIGCSLLFLLLELENLFWIGSILGGLVFMNDAAWPGNIFSTSDVIGASQVSFCLLEFRVFRWALDLTLFTLSGGLPGLVAADPFAAEAPKFICMCFLATVWEGAIPAGDPKPKPNCWAWRSCWWFWRFWSAFVKWTDLLRWFVVREISEPAVPFIWLRPEGAAGVFACLKLFLTFCFCCAVKLWRL